MQHDFGLPPVQQPTCPATATQLQVNKASTLATSSASCIGLARAGTPAHSRNKRCVSKPVRKMNGTCLDLSAVHTAPVSAAPSATSRMAAEKLPFSAASKAVAKLWAVTISAPA